MAYVEAHPAALKRSSFAPLDEPSEVLYWHRDHQSWPIFVDASILEEMTAAARDVLAVERRFVDAWTARAPEAVRTLFDLPGDVPLELLADEATDHLVSRQDLVLSRRGFEVLECNVTGHVGGWEAMVAVQRSVACEPTRDFLARAGAEVAYADTLGLAVSHMVSAVQRKCGVPIEECNLALLTGIDYPAALEPLLQWKYAIVCRELGCKKTGQLGICRPEAVGVGDGGVTIDGERVHGLLTNPYDEAVPRGVLEEAVAGRVCLFNGPAGSVLSEKATLALVSNACDEGELSEADDRIVRAHVPWTRIVRPGRTRRQGAPVDLLDHVSRHRAELVLKASLSLRGEHVVVGRDSSDEEWGAAVRGAVEGRDTWVVQEYVESLPAMLQRGAEGCVPHRTVLGAFVVGSTDAGAVFRMSPVSGHAIVNQATCASVQIPLVTHGSRVPGYPLTELTV